MAPETNYRLLFFSGFVVAGCVLGSKSAYLELTERWRAVLSTAPVPVSIVRSFESSGRYSPPSWLVQTPKGDLIRTAQVHCANPPTCLVYFTESDRIIPAETGFDTAIDLLEVSAFAGGIFLTALVGPFAFLVFALGRRNSVPVNLLDHSPVTEGLLFTASVLAIGINATAIELFRTERYVASLGNGLFSVGLLYVVAGFIVRRRRRRQNKKKAPRRGALQRGVARKKNAVP